MRCADDKIQMCHLIIVRFTIDYEEQVVITSVKSGLQCPICTISICEWKNLYN